jgi:uncharacterized protein YprB with RNaseH-like and TPR domain
MDNHERIARVFFDIETVGIQAGSGRITNRMLKRIERNRVILDSMRNDDELQPVVTRLLKVISLYRDFAKAFNAGNAVDGKRISDEILTLIYECKAYAKRGDSF